MQDIYFNKNLKYLTEKTNINQAKLAQMLGITRQAINNLIINNTDVRISTVIKIADVYKINPSDLLFKELG